MFIIFDLDKSCKFYQERQFFFEFLNNNNITCSRYDFNYIDNFKDILFEECGDNINNIMKAKCFNDSLLFDYDNYKKNLFNMIRITIDNISNNFCINNYISIGVDYTYKKTITLNKKNLIIKSIDEFNLKYSIEYEYPYMFIFYINSQYPNFKIRDLKNILINLISYNKLFTFNNLFFIGDLYDALNFFSNITSINIINKYKQNYNLYCFNKYLFYKSQNNYDEYLDNSHNQNIINYTKYYFDDTSSCQYCLNDQSK